MKTKTNFTKHLLTMILMLMAGNLSFAGTNISLRFTSSDTGTKTSNTTFGDFTVYATSSNSVTVKSGSATVGGENFSYKLDLGGERAATYRLVGFHVDGPCTIRTYGQSNSSSTRHLVLSASESTPLGATLNNTYCVSSSSAVVEDYNYTGNAAYIYIGSYNSGYSIYGIDVIYPDGSGNSENTGGGEVSNPAAGSSMTFDATKRYSEWVVNSRISNFKGNTSDMSFAKYTDAGVKSASSVGSELDYVPGLVAKAILEAVDYYKDNTEVNVKPWYYAVQDYANKTIKKNGKDGKSFDDLNAVKLYFKLKEIAQANVFPDAADSNISNEKSVTTSNTRLSEALAGIKTANSNYAISESLLPGAAGGWWHKSSYTNQMWCDGQYMGPALLAQMLNEYDNYENDGYIAGSKSADWDLVTKQFTISWNYLWNPEVKLLYHAFTADPECTEDNNSNTNAYKWAGFPNSDGIYHSAEYWGRAEGWYFLALVDVLEQMQIAGLTRTENYNTLHGYLNQLAAGIAAKQDTTSGCWYQLLNHDGSFVAQTYNSSYRYTDSPVANYLESSASAIFAAAYLKGMRLGLYDTDYTEIAKKAYKGIVENFMVADGNGGVHLIACCKSAGVGGKNFRDGSAEYYLMGNDTEPTVADPTSSSFYTEGKVFGGFILAATEYERLFMDKKLELTENGSYTEFAPGDYNEVTLTRTFPENQWSTMVVPFAISAEQIQSAFGANTEVANVSRITDEKLYLSKTSDISANEPVLIKVGSVNADNTYTFTDVTIENADTKVQAGDGVQLNGTYTVLTGGQSGDLGATEYFIHDNLFSDCTYMNRMKPFRAYITATNAFGAKELNIEFEEEQPTAIATVDAKGIETQAPAYNIAGQRIASASGIIIQNGKKTVIN